MSNPVTPPNPITKAISVANLILQNPDSPQVDKDWATSFLQKASNLKVENGLVSKRSR
jgi:hypothetical protein